MAKTNFQITLEYLLTGKIITTRMAPAELGITDVRNYIATLRKKNYQISDRWVKGFNRRGKKTRYKEYFIEKNLLLTKYIKLIKRLNIRLSWPNDNK